MRIGFDARQVYRAQRRGINNSVLELYRHLLEVRPDWQVVAYHRDKQWADQTLPAERIETRCIDLPGDRFGARATQTTVAVTVLAYPTAPISTRRPDDPPDKRQITKEELLYPWFSLVPELQSLFS